MGIRSFFSRRFAACGNRGGWIVRRISRRLKLDSTQEGRLQSVHTALDSLRSDARQDLAQRRQAISEILSRDKLDREEALRLSRAPVAKVNDVLPTLVERFADFYDNLSADQRGRLRDMLLHRGCRRHCGS